jgi:hypothetical protein
MFSAPILVIMVILPGLFEGFRISISFTKSLGFILSLTYIPQITCQFDSQDDRTSTVPRFHLINRKKGFKINLYAKRVGHTTEEFNMSSIKLTSALTNPQHVG